MATIKYQLLSKSEICPIYLRLSVGRGVTPRAKTGLQINSKDWSSKTGFPKQNSADNKNLLYQLQELSSHVFKSLNQASANGELIDKGWLEKTINVFFKRTTIDEVNENLIDNIDRILQNASTRPNGKGGFGVSKTRIDTLKGLKSSLLDFGAKGKRIKDVNKKFAQGFHNFLLQEKKYSQTTAVKKLADLKTVCYDALQNGIEVHPQLQGIKTTKKERPKPIVLSEEELQLIRELKIPNKRLDNARKWLLLGCSVGQRGGDLLRITEDNIRELNDFKVIEIQQEKTGKKVVIPIVADAVEIVNDGLPHPISIQKFNNYIKELCKLAEIDKLVEGSKRKSIKDSNGNSVIRDVEGSYPKHELVSSHICRRSFATNLYGKLPTHLIMSVTGHKKESTFLAYIGKSNIDFAKEFASYF